MIQGDTGGYTGIQGDTGGYGPPSPPAGPPMGPVMLVDAARTRLAASLVDLLRAQTYTREHEWAAACMSEEADAWERVQRCNQEFALALFYGHLSPNPPA